VPFWKSNLFQKESTIMKSKFIPKPPTQLMGLLAAFLLMLLIPASYTHATPSSFSCDDVSEIPPSECEALVALHNSTNGWPELGR
jgi:hypothetical protein